MSEMQISAQRYLFLWAFVIPCANRANERKQKAVSRTGTAKRDSWIKWGFMEIVGAYCGDRLSTAQVEGDGMQRRLPLVGVAFLPPPSIPECGLAFVSTRRSRFRYLPPTGCASRVIKIRPNFEKRFPRFRFAGLFLQRKKHPHRGRYFLPVHQKTITSHMPNYAAVFTLNEENP